MSEYQYYEFQAIDRPLTEKEMSKLRACSSRARITPTSFVNDYAWGDFRANEDAWIEKYFDAFLYVANWGTHRFKMRLPGRLLDAKTARAFCAGEHAKVREKDGKVILTFVSEDEEGSEWIEGGGQLSSLLPLRSDLDRGDLRGLYLAWLLCAQSDDLDDDATEPPVPPGLAKLSAPLESLVEFLRIDPDLLRVAAEASAPLVDTELKPAEVRKWLAKQPPAKKDDLLARLIMGNDGALASEIVQRLRCERRGDRGGRITASKRRTVAELLHAAEQRPRGRRPRKAALARAKDLD